MRHLFMGGYGHHAMMMGGFGHRAMMMGFGGWLLMRMVRRIVTLLVIGGLVAAVVVLWLRLQAAKRGAFYNGP